jgi:hypothetical protein
MKLLQLALPGAAQKGQVLALQPEIGQHALVYFQPLGTRPGMRARDAQSPLEDAFTPV